jgi:hypothetical protein
LKYVFDHEVKDPQWYFGAEAPVFEALHGLSEIALACPEKVRDVIDRFLHKTKLDDKLLAYALNARKGNVF